MRGEEVVEYVGAVSEIHDRTEFSCAFETPIILNLVFERPIALFAFLENTCRKRLDPVRSEAFFFEGFVNDKCIQR